MRNAYLIIDDKEIDISEKKAIVFGAGANAITVCDSCNIENVLYIIDNDEKKWGRYCKVSSSFVKICSPDILKSLNSYENYICIFTEIYKEEIKKSIKSITDIDYMIIDSEKMHFWKYDSIDELFEQDFYVRQKLVDLRISNVSEYLCRIKKELNRIDEIIWYMPIKKGHKLCIKCIGKTRDYLVSLGSKASRNAHDNWHDALSNPIMEISINTVTRKLDLMKDITYYDDGEIIIQKFCSQNVDFKSVEIRKCVLEKIVKIHDKKIDLDVKANPFKRYELMADKLDGDKKAKIRIINDKISEYKKYYVEKRFVLSHGDLHHGNIVFNDEKCVLIDWEFLCYTYEYYDVCRFLFYSQIDEFSSNNTIYESSMQELYGMLPFYLMYYKSEIDENEIRDAKIMLFLCEIIELLLRFNRRQKNAVELIPIIEEHISLI